METKNQQRSSICDDPGRPEEDMMKIKSAGLYQWFWKFWNPVPGAGMFGAPGTGFLCHRNLLIIHF